MSKLLLISSNSTFYHHLLLCYTLFLLFIIWVGITIKSLLWLLCSFHVALMSWNNELLGFKPSPLGVPRFGGLCRTFRHHPLWVWTTGLCGVEETQRRLATPDEKHSTEHRGFNLQGASPLVLGPASFSIPMPLSLSPSPFSILLPSSVSPYRSFLHLSSSLLFPPLPLFCAAMNPGPITGQANTLPRNHIPN